MKAQGETLGSEQKKKPLAPTRATESARGNHVEAEFLVMCRLMARAPHNRAR